MSCRRLQEEFYLDVNAAETTLFNFSANSSKGGWLAVGKQRGDEWGLKHTTSSNAGKQQAALFRLVEVASPS